MYTNWKMLNRGKGCIQAFSNYLSEIVSPNVDVILKNSEFSCQDNLYLSRSKYEELWQISSNVSEVLGHLLFVVYCPLEFLVL